MIFETLVTSGSAQYSCSIEALAAHMHQDPYRRQTCLHPGLLQQPGTPEETKALNLNVRGGAGAGQLPAFFGFPLHV